MADRKKMIDIEPLCHSYLEIAMFVTDRNLDIKITALSRLLCPGSIENLTRSAIETQS
jgi:hypothetical protein